MACDVQWWYNSLIIGLLGSTHSQNWWREQRLGGARRRQKTRSASTLKSRNLIDTSLNVAQSKTELGILTKHTKKLLRIVQSKNSNGCRFEWRDNILGRFLVIIEPPVITALSLLPLLLDNRASNGTESLSKCDKEIPTRFGAIRRPRRIGTEPGLS